ncbi:helix-turn-helix transcriptional regulator [Anaerotignum lactatifermentans]|uniref:Helix-turn-helix transcriptional regulator n=1 Tax=Anaerotignum lactatifermentans TaxID=160404 RepID=A0ABS2GAA5_9FIRM|nr:helix-turn-helix transcriptional regulator [Anaerotignum lactatifermentans]MBM6830268.1 helix-turn-helix transcriptional regulator [Anaerotignum lactatifermentans]MBM6878356.1 helix-turn-helix transcriptional regulator [Anaerotignum lactatifermentans]MBM6951511.1 helix-turn-helix transcriptional regulator [Anaerotignum lactatifermentans]MBQ7084596.1 helix-turn-helix transcriptional regulator [Anaerotignum sp.]
MSDLSIHTGKRIKLYRKNKQLSQDQLAEMICKSKSAISKYERGAIPIDIDTLQDIANALDITIHQLIDIDTKKSHTLPGLQGFFSNTSRLYTYYLNKNSSRIVRGVLEINQTDDCEYSTVFYTDVVDYDNLHHCAHLYFGDIHYSDSYVNMLLKNQSNEAERIFFNIANSFNNNATLTIGMLSGISSKYMVPISLKVLISKYPLPEDAELKESLRFSKEDFTSMKRTFCFSIERLM